MPRSLELKVQDWPLLKQKPYPMEVLSLRKKGQAILVTLAHLDPEQAGHEHEFSLLLPLLPANLPSLFFKACGFPVCVGSKVNAKDAIGKRLLVTFEPSADRGEPRPLHFAPLKEKGAEGSPEGSRRKNKAAKTS